MKNTIHDYTKRYWGHDFAVLDIRKEGFEITASGWGSGIKKGDMMIFPNEGDTTRYKVMSIKYQLDPSDMWFAEMKFTPRTEKE